MKKIYKEYYKDLKTEDIKVVDYRRIKNETAKALTESIRLNGLINPITVEETYDGQFHLIAGYHRLKAFMLLGIKCIPCNIRKFNNDISDREKDLTNSITKQEENHVRQTFSIAEIAQDYNELENAYKRRFPSYAEDPVKYIEKYKEKMIAKKRAENLVNTAPNKRERKLYEDQLNDIQRELEETRPPSENIANLFSDASKEDIASAKKIAECEKKYNGIIKNLVDDSVPKTTINKVVNELVQPKVAEEYVDSTNKEERKELIDKLVIKTKVNKFGLEIEQLNENIYKVGKIKTHCIAMIDKLHLVPENKYNVTINVSNKNMLSSVLASFELEYFKVLVLFYDKKLFDNFIDSFN